MPAKNHQMKRVFPVIKRVGERLPSSIPWASLTPHEARIKKNHGLPLESLAERGGLSPMEIYCAMNDLSLPFKGHEPCTRQEAEIFVCTMNFDI